MTIAFTSTDLILLRPGIIKLLATNTGQFTLCNKEKKIFIIKYTKSTDSFASYHQVWLGSVN